MAEGKRTREELQQLQALPLEVKIKKTEQRIKEWVDAFGLDGVVISFSGGKDSLALLHLARNIYPDMRAVYVNTGLEYPEIVKFVKTFDNVDIIRPTMTFVEVIKKYGYPMISKEVADCVSGARKYLTQVLEENDILMADRQTDALRLSTNIGSKDCLESVSIQDRIIWQAIQKCQKTGLGGGGAVKRFSQLAGVLTSKSTVDARLWKNYRQFQSTAFNGYSSGSEDGQSNDGEYP